MSKNLFKSQSASQQKVVSSAPVTSPAEGNGDSSGGGWNTSGGAGNLFGGGGNLLGEGGNLMRDTLLETVEQMTSGADRGTEFQATIVEPVTGNPMPSMPSISNVGAAPFTGVVNWNAIPGGFQPLPQQVGGRKKLYQLSKFHGGINQKSSPRDIADMECQEATNVTVSQVGRIKMLGDIKSTSSGLTTSALATSASHIPSPGYGLYIFKSAYSLASTPIVGDFTIVASTDGQHVSLKDNGSPTTKDDYLDISSADTHVAPVFYAAGNGLYACDANLTHTEARKATILVYRKDYVSSGESSMTTNLWVDGKAMIDSPTYDTTATDGAVNLEWDDGTVSFTATSVAGSSTVHIGSSGSGNWSGNYYFYISWLFDSGCETGLTSLVTTGASAPNGPFTFADEQLSFNFSV